VGLALIYGDVDDGIPQLHGFTAAALLLVTFTVLIMVAVNEVRKKRADRLKKKEEAARSGQIEQDGSEPPGSDISRGATSQKDSSAFADLGGPAPIAVLGIAETEIAGAKAVR
jgi:hypothetical protein